MSKLIIFSYELEPFVFLFLWTVLLLAQFSICLFTIFSSICRSSLSIMNINLCFYIFPNTSSSLVVVVAFQLCLWHVFPCVFLKNYFFVFEFINIFTCCIWILSSLEMFSPLLANGGIQVLFLSYMVSWFTFKSLMRWEFALVSLWGIDLSLSSLHDNSVMISPLISMSAFSYVPTLSDG